MIPLAELASLFIADCLMRRRDAGDRLALPLPHLRASDGAGHSLRPEQPDGEHATSDQLDALRDGWPRLHRRGRSDPRPKGRGHMARRPLGETLREA